MRLSAAGVDARLAIPAIVAWVVLGALLGAPDWLGLAAVALWTITAVAGSAALLSAALLSAALFGARGRQVLVMVTVIGAAAALLLSSAALLNTLRRPAELVAAAGTGRFITATVVMDATVSHTAGQYPVGHDPAVPDPAGSPQASRGPIPVTITAVTIGSTEVRGLGIPAVLFGALPEGGVGTVLAVSGTVANADAGEHAQFLVFARGSPRILSAPPWYLDGANSLREGFRSAATALPGDGGALLPGLAIGDTSAVDDTLDSAMKATSLSHLTAVSGANCAVVVGLVMIGGAAIGLSRRWRVGCSLLILLGFVVLVTPSASVLRAAVMAALVLGSLASGRPVRGLPVLSLAVIVLLTIDPWLARDYGFMLSVLATGGLLLLAGPLAGLLARWMPLPLAAMISIPLAAQLACQPVLILLNPAVPVYGVVANLLSEPAAPIATVLGLLACVALPAFDPLGRVIAAIAWLPSAWIAAVARFFDELPGAQAPWLAGTLGVGLMALVILLGLLVVLRWGSSRYRRLATALLVLTVASYGGALLGNGMGRLVSIPRDWQIAACDVGQGDALLVRSAGQVALIDTGPDPRRLADCLRELGIQRLQLLVLTHYDTDHVGGAAAVVGLVDRVLVGPASEASDLRLRRTFVEAGAELEEASRGQVGILGELGWQVLWPPARLGSIEPGNPASVTLRFEGVGACRSGCLSSIFLGDLGEEAQSRMLGITKPPPVEVVKVAHHGSADQSARLYERLQARVGLISVGAGNSYGHPTDKLLGILNQQGTAIARTDLEGMILLSPAPDGGLAVWTQRTPEPPGPAR